MSLQVEFNHNFLPVITSELTLSSKSPNSTYYLEKINKNLNKYCERLFSQIKTFANQDVQLPFPFFESKIATGPYLPMMVHLEIKKIFEKIAIELHFTQALWDHNTDLFGEFLKDKCIRAMSPLAKWQHDNPYLFAQKAPEVKKPSFVYSLAEHNKVFWQAAQAGEGCDVVFIVGEKKFPAHRCFVTKHSEVLQKLLTRMKEAEQKEIEIKEDKPEWFYCLLYFIYNGALPPEQKLTLTTLDQIHQIADKYDVKPLRLLSQDLFEVEYATLVITKENFAEIFEMASRKSDQGLTQKCVDFASHSDDTLQLLADQVDSQNLMLVLKTALGKRPNSTDRPDPAKKTSV